MILTEKQKKRDERDKRILSSFNRLPGNKGERVEHLSKFFKVSPATIRRVLYLYRKEAASE